MSYVALYFALLAYYCSAVGASPLAADRKRRLAVAGIAAWIGFHAVLAGLGVVDLQLYSIAYDSIVRFYEQAGGPVAAAMTGEVGVRGGHGVAVASANTLYHKLRARPAGA